LERRAANAPAPGARPKKKKRPPKPPVDGDEGFVEHTESGATEVSDAVEPPAADQETPSNGSANGSASKPTTNASTRNGSANSTPRKANNRPKKRR
jgi:YidC/Oxa1 family membrane protein insertase